MIETCSRNHPQIGDYVDKQNRCKRCKRLWHYRRWAIERGLPLCPEGHGLMLAGVSEDGRCTECEPWSLAPPATWLDWAAVHNALDGLRPARELTSYEITCAFATVMSRLEIGSHDAAAWLRENTLIPVPDDNGDYLLLRWLRKKNLKMLTVTEALGYTNAPDHQLALLANEIDEDELEDPAA